MARRRFGFTGGWRPDAGERSHVRDAKDQGQVFGVTNGDRFLADLPPDSKSLSPSCGDPRLRDRGTGLWWMRISNRGTGSLEWCRLFQRACPNADAAMPRAPGRIPRKASLSRTSRCDRSGRAAEGAEEFPTAARPSNPSPTCGPSEARRTTGPETGQAAPMTP